MAKTIFINVAGIIGFLFLFSPLSYAGREPESWDILPAIDEIVFSPRAVGFAARDGRRFILTRSSKTFSPAGEDGFKSEFSENAGGKAAVILENRGINSSVLLKTSAGVNIETTDAYCSEGSNTGHSLKIGGVTFNDRVRPCASVGAAEIENGRLWLGTRYDGEYGEYPADGIVVQSLQDGALIKQISNKEGLAGNLIRAIKLDPYAKNVWTAAHLGINELSPDFKILFTGYFYEGFDENTGSSVIKLSSSPVGSAGLAVLQRKIGVKDKAGYYAAVLSIPPETRNCFNPYGWDQLSKCPDSNRGFLPGEFNALVPFLISAIRSGTGDYMREALAQICFFKDPAIADLLAEMEADQALMAKWNFYVRACADKYSSMGIISEKKKAERAGTLLRQIAGGLAKYNLAVINNSFPPDYEVQQSIIEGAKSLLAMGDSRGMELINDHFLRSAGGHSTPNSMLFTDMAQQFYNYNEFLPAILSGIQKFYGAPAGGGCLYLDMTYTDETRKSRLNAGNLPALLKAAENATHPETVPHQPSQAEAAYVSCKTALESQLKDKTVREEFRRRIYPSLTPARKKIADDILTTTEK